MRTHYKRQNDVGVNPTHGKSRKARPRVRACLANTKLTIYETRVLFCVYKDIGNLKLITNCVRDIMSCLHTLLLCGLSLAHARFLYKQEPLVRVSPAVGDSDLFGYAVAFHRVDDTGDPNDFDHAISNTM